ncbi:GDSL-type esterase/lipase family protein [Dysgonomonas sp. 25]|uniref:GDSL-type esterase/lipase family protein n=1 Tax=Dysgonomonas sp. 25 TaxID=2302933 RepID=UPI0013D8933F|nr:GDSL-type esterase/lipase family protein [Dysgonomonas sp. 25]NDV67970.1 hypothetical protein [Dysgonomonas sp. 25]
MKKFLLLSVLLLCTISCLWAQDTIRVACVGNSITRGWGLPEDYPAMLGKILGDKYKVGNFGENSRTVLNRGDYPYMRSDVFFGALKFMPDVVVIKLGTNDSKPENWQYGSDYEKDLTSLITIFQHIPSHPEIYLCYPAKVYGDTWGISDETITNNIIPIIKKVAEERNLQIIDLHSATDGMEENFPDKVHPDSQGAAAIAVTVYRAIAKE